MARPTQKTIPFARDGNKNTIPTAGASTDEGASYQMGFPPRTMADDATAVPPTGEDMNGILNDLSVASIYQQSGGFYPFNGTYAQAIGGYPIGAILLKADGSGHWKNNVEGNQTNPDNGGAGWVDFSASLMIGATSTANGKAGAAPAPLIADRGKFLCGDGTWKATSGIPIGAELIFYGSTAPDGFLICNGTEVSRTAYPELFQAIGTLHGDGDGSTTFNLPDRINYPYAKGVESADVGEKLEAGLPNITGTIETLSGRGSITGNGAFSAGANSSYSYSGYSSSGGGKFASVSIDASDSNDIYSDDIDTVQPSSTGVLPCIKAFDSAVNQGTVDVTALANSVNTLASKPHVVEMGENSAGWWIIYSNGWVEQGNENVSSDTTIALPIEMQSDDYNLMATMTHITSSTLNSTSYVQAGVKTETSFFVRTRTEAKVFADAIDWKVEGWKA